MRALGTSSVDVQARAVAGLEGSDKCLYVLNPTAQEAILVSASGITVPCGIVVNSNHATKATNITGGVGGNPAYITATNGARIEMKGGYSGSVYTPLPTTGVNPSIDPLLYLTPPVAAATCDAAHTNWSKNSGTWSLTSGTYCGGIAVSGSATLNLGAGTYILKGGGLKVQGNNARINGDGVTGGSGRVTFYNTCNDGTCASSTGFAFIEIKSGAIANLRAPTAGPLSNILFFVDRHAPSQTTLFDSATFNFDGTIYSPIGPVTFKGGAVGTFLKLNLVIDTLLFTGGSTLALDHTYTGNQSAIKEPALVE
jgi:hypothetical protein